MEIKEMFEQAVGKSKTLSEKPANETLLQMYGLFKQSTEGDINIPSPANAFDFVAKAKFAAWEQLKGSSKDAAMQQYIDLIEKLHS